MPGSGWRDDAVAKSWLKAISSSYLDKTTVTLYRRVDNSDDEYRDGVEWERAHGFHPQVMDDSGMSVTRRQWNLYQLDETVSPRRGDKIVDEDGNTWHIERVESFLLGRFHKCDTVKAQ